MGAAPSTDTHVAASRHQGHVTGSQTVPTSAEKTVAHHPRVQLGSQARPGWVLYGSFAAGIAVLGASTWYGVRLSKTQTSPNSAVATAMLRNTPELAVVKPAASAEDRLHPAFRRVPGTKRSAGGMAVRCFVWAG